MTRPTEKSTEKKPKYIKFMYMSLLEPAEREEAINQADATPSRIIRLALQDSTVYAFQILRSPGDTEKAPTVYLGTDICTFNGLLERSVDASITNRLAQEEDTLHFVKAKNGEWYPFYRDDKMYNLNDNLVYDVSPDDKLRQPRPVRAMRL